jgi:hypothetical protein
LQDNVDIYDLQGISGRHTLLETLRIAQAMENNIDKRHLLEELKANPRKIRFTRLCSIAEEFGFQTRKGTGSHRVYYRDGVREILDFQNESGRAKAYQVKQLIKIIERYNLSED